MLLNRLCKDFHHAAFLVTSRYTSFALRIIGLLKTKQKAGCTWPKLPQQKLFCCFQAAVLAKANLTVRSYHSLREDLAAMIWREKKSQTSLLIKAWTKPTPFGSICTTSSVFFSHRVLMLFMNSLVMHSRTMLYTHVQHIMYMILHDMHDIFV